MKFLRYCFFIWFVFIFMINIFAENLINPALSQEKLHSLIFSALMDEVAKNTYVDSLNVEKLQMSILEQINNINIDVNENIIEGHITQLDLHFNIMFNSIDAINPNPSIECVIEIIYDVSNNEDEPIVNLINKDLNIVLSSANSRYTKQFSININDFIKENTNEQGPISKNTEVEGTEDEVSIERNGIFLVTYNGVFSGYMGRNLSNSAYAGKRLTEISLPIGIESIGSRCFANNRLTKIKIPHTVTLIAANAFSSNNIESVSIGANVQLERDAIGRGFENFYWLNEKKAGTYIYRSYRWIFQG